MACLLPLALPSSSRQLSCGTPLLLHSIRRNHLTKSWLPIVSIKWCLQRTPRSRELTSSHSTRHSAATAKVRKPRPGLSGRRVARWVTSGLACCLTDSVMQQVHSTTPDCISLWLPDPACTVQTTISAQTQGCVSIACLYSIVAACFYMTVQETSPAQKASIPCRCLHSLGPLWQPEFFSLQPCRCSRLAISGLKPDSSQLMT